MQRGASQAVRPSGSGRIPRTGSVTVTKNASGRLVQEVLTNKNVSWMDYPGVWACYIAMIVLGWLGMTALLGGDGGLAWTYVHLIHGLVTYYALHWVKGSVDPEDGGQYESLTVWEQMDDGHYGTLNRKFFTAVPVVLYLLATNGTPFTKQPLGLNLALVILLVFAKLSYFHKVRIFGINK